MREKPVIPIVIHLGEIGNSEMLGAKIQAILQRNHKTTQFMITIPERDPRPIVTGPQPTGADDI